MRYVPLIALALAASGCSGCEKQTPAPQQIAAPAPAPQAAEPAAVKPADPAPAAQPAQPAQPVQAAQPADSTEDKMRAAVGNANDKQRTTLTTQQAKIKRLPKKLILAPKLMKPVRPGQQPAAQPAQ